VTIKPVYIARTVFCLVTAWLLGCSYTFAQQDASRMFKKYTTKDGLLNNGIYSLQRSKNGMWWIATGSGLQRFDGYNFETWNDIADTVNGFSPASQNVHEDKKGNVWLFNFTEHYVAPAGSKLIKRVRVEPDKKIPYPDYVPFPALEDETRLWCYQGNTGFFGFNKQTTNLDTIIHVRFKDNLKKLLANSPTVAHYQHQTAWVTLDFEDSSYVVRFTPGKPLVVKSFANKQFGFIKGVIPINEEEVLFISTRYTAICKNDRLENPMHLLSKENIPGNFIRGLPYERLNVYNKGSIIFPGEKGIYEFIPSQKVLRPYSSSAYPEINLSRQLMFALKEDEWGNLWIGRDGSDGLLVYFPGKLKFEFLKAPAEYFNLVYSLAVTEDGTVYEANFQKGINIFDKDGRWKKHVPLPNIENGLSPSIRVINLFNSNELILKSLDGKLFILDVNTHAVTNLSDLIPKNVSAYNNIFDANIIKIKDNESHYTHGRYIVQVTKHNSNYRVAAIDSVPETNTIMSLAYSTNGERIAGTTGGIFTKKEKWTVIPGTEKFPIKHISIDPDGAIWAAGSHGICKVVNKKVVKIYNEASGLLNEFIYGVLFDADGNAWYSSNRGLGCIRKDGSISFYTEADGLQGDEFDTQSFWKSNDGKKLYFGGIQGITAFNPRDVLQNSQPGQIQLSSIQVNEKPYPQRSRIDDIRSIELPDSQNSLTFNFTLTNFTDPDYNVYKVKLDGVNNEWVNLKNSHSVRYLLVPGHYTLHIKGSSDGSNWSEEKLIPIVIQPAWWQTNLFRWSIGIFILGLAGSGAWYYNKIKTKELKRQFELEVQMQKERERISRDLHDHIGAYSTALIANADALEQQLEDEKALKTVSYLKENSKNILTTLRETIWLLNTNNLTVKRFYEGFINYSTNILRNHEGIEIEFTDAITNNAQLQPAKAIHLLRILQEAIQNIVKHAQATHIGCVLTCDKQLTITISDNGKGFNPDLIIKGNGLFNMQQRAEEINFTLAIKSTMGKGTTITLTGSV
jgi:signal transduction histidine kinase